MSFWSISLPEAVNKWQFCWRQFVFPSQARFIFILFRFPWQTFKHHFFISTFLVWLESSRKQKFWSLSDVKQNFINTFFQMQRKFSPKTSSAFFKRTLHISNITKCFKNTKKAIKIWERFAQTVTRQFWSLAN